MRPNPLIPQRLRGIATTILYANEIFSRNPNLGIDDLGEEVYLGILTDSDNTIRSGWIELAKVKLKEITDEFAPIGTQTTWGLYFKRELIENEEVQQACFVQLSHRRDGLEHAEDFPGDMIFH